MIEFHRVTLADKARYDAYSRNGPSRGCEYSFSNVFLWGQKQIAYLHSCVAFFSHAYGWTLYPIGDGDKMAVVDALVQDARERGVRFHLTGATEADKNQLEEAFPGRFQITPIRDSFDYVYAIDALAELKGKKLQKKRNHVNRFRLDHPDYQAEPLSRHNREAARHMMEDWFSAREDAEEFTAERQAIRRAFECFDELELEGMLLRCKGKVFAVTMASRLSGDTFDVHFEKAREGVDGAYSTINWEFARYLREKYPEVRYLNREEDMGLPGLRKAKQSYKPDHLLEKYWVCFGEDKHEN